MVRWKCNGCNNYNNKMFGAKTCDACGLPMGRFPQETLQRAREFFAQPPQAPLAPVAPVPVPLPVQEPAVVKSVGDARCGLGAHVCKHCEGAFFVKNEEETTNKKK